MCTKILKYFLSIQVAFHAVFETKVIHNIGCVLWYMIITKHLWSHPLTYEREQYPFYQDACVASYGILLPLYS